MATFAPNEMYLAQQQQQPSSQQPRMAYPQLDLSFTNGYMQYQGPSSPLQGQMQYHAQSPSLPGQMQYQGPSSPPPGQIQYQGVSSPPPGNGDSPCGGTVESVINHRVFVGSLQIDVNEETLKNVFEKVEPTLSIRDIKIVRESNGQSKGYGFITYGTEEDAQKIIGKKAGTFIYKGRTWNIAPAVRRFTPHPSPAFYCYPYSPSLYSMTPGGMVGYLSPSPYMTSPMMDQSQFVFPPLQQQQQQ